MRLILVFITTLLLVLGISACSDRDDSPKEESAAVGGMKCGAGKCGANMFDGNAALVKKKANITAQMKEDDPRRDCVFKAATTQEAYDCVRDAETGKLSTKCGNGSAESSSTKVPAPKEEPAMKCGAGKCGSSM